MPGRNERQAIAHFLIGQPVGLGVAVGAGIDRHPPSAAVAQVALAVAGVVDDQVVVLAEGLAQRVEGLEDGGVLGVEQRGDLEAVVVAQQRLHRFRIMFGRGD